MQTNLFSDAFPLQEQGIACLKKFEFSRALDYLQQARDLSADIPNNRVYFEAAQFCLANQFNITTPAAQMVSLWEMLHQEQTFAAEANALQKVLFEVFARRLLDIEAFDASGVLQHGDICFHISACDMHANQFEAARQSLTQQLSDDESPLPARYWGYFGDAALATSHAREANLGYLRLLASNPFDVDWSVFQHRRLKTRFQSLLKQYNLQIAYGSWPFAAWQDELIYVPPSNRYIQKMLEDNLKRYDPNLALTPYEKHLRFALLVLCDQSDPSGNKAVHLRIMMKELDGKKFQQYLSTVNER